MGSDNLASTPGTAYDVGDAQAVALPPGAIKADEWQTDSDVRPYRMVMGTDRVLAGMTCLLRTTAMQFTDGSVDDATWIEAPVVHVVVGTGEPFTAEQARQFAALLTECAEELDRMRGADPTNQAGGQPHVQ